MYCLPVQKLRERAHPGGRSSCCPPQASSFPSPASTPPAPSPSLERHFSCAPRRRGSSSRSRVLAGGGSRSRPAHSQVGQSPSQTSGCLQVALNPCTQDLHPTRGRSVREESWACPLESILQIGNLREHRLYFSLLCLPTRPPRCSQNPGPGQLSTQTGQKAPGTHSRCSGQRGFPGVSP